MPLFEFRCSACGHLEEVLQKHSDAAPDPCPKCGVEKTMSRELSLSAFHLKGGGWYKDLYASSSTTTAAEPSAKSDAKTETKSTSTTETKTTTAAPAAAAPAAAPAAAAPSATKPAAA